MSQMHADTYGSLERELSFLESELDEPIDDMHREYAEERITELYAIMNDSTIEII